MRGRAKTAALCMMALLLAATFFSRTIVYHLTAKCTVAEVYSGRLSAQLRYWEAAIPPEYAGSYALPALGEEAVVSLIRCRSGERVKKGDILMELSPAVCGKRLKALQKERTAAREKAALFRVNYPIAAAAAEAEAAAAQKALARSNTRTRPAAERQVAKAEEALRLIRDEGILDGMTQAALDGEEAALGEAVEALSALERAGWRIAAPEDAVLIDVRESADKDGRLFSFVPTGKPLPLTVKVDAALAPHLQMGQKLTFRSQDGKAVGGACAVSAVDAYKGELTLTLEGFLPENLSALENAKLQTAVTDYDALVPPAALIKENAVYVVKKGQSWWGENWVVEERRVAAAPGSDTATPIVSGLSEGEMVITAWDRPIRPGDRVVLPL